jgi:hypothetical protein
MIKTLQKTIILTAFICCSALISKAQLGYNYAQWDAGVELGYNKVYGDAESFTSTASVHFNINYNTSPYVNYIFEVQTGKLEGGNELKDTTGRQFSNSFTAIIFRMQVQGGELIDYSESPLANAFKNLYVSTGVGYIVNKLKTNRYSYKIEDFYTPGEDNSNEILIPLRIGYEFKVFNSYGEPTVKIDLGYQYNFIMGDELDGFKTGKTNDAYSQLVIGLKFAIGGVTSYRKQIYY